MNTYRVKIRFSVLTFAVQAALLTIYGMPVQAEEDEVAALKNPTNTVEIGVSNTSQDSPKFGEYTGLTKSGADAVVNFNIRGGDAYGESEGTKRWSVTGTDLGLTSRSAAVNVSNQGKWNIGIGYDELQHNTATGYQTPYIGEMGGNNFVLPATFGTTTNTTTLSPATQLSAFHTMDINNTRKATSFTAGFILSPEWSVRIDQSRLDQTGAKLASFGLNGSGGVASSGEKIAILPAPTNFRTDTLNLALNWIGERGTFTTSYYGSFFRDNNDSVTAQSFWTGASNNVMTTPPSNDFHQLNFVGGYKMADATKLSGGLSYARTTQNSDFVVSPLMNAVAPVNSLNGTVINTHADLKLTNQSTKDLDLSAAIKYDLRDNQTASNFYSFNAIGWTGTGTANPAIFPNTPLSNSKTQLELAGDYRMARSQHVRIAYNRENIARWCSNYAVSSGIAAGALGYYPDGTNCVVAYASKDDKLSATYKTTAGEDLSINVGYGYSRRITDSDPNAITARIGANAYTGNVIKGLNSGDRIGFYPFFDASRVEQMIKGGANYEASEHLTYGMNLKYTSDEYLDSTYGRQHGSTWSVNLDATYAYSENGTFSPYISEQHRQRDTKEWQRATASAATATAVAVPADGTWNNFMVDDDITLGLGAKQKGLMHGKFELAGDLTYSLAKTRYKTELNYYTLSSGGLTCDNPAIGSCGTLPDISNETIQLKLTGIYQVSKQSKVTMVYIYQSLKSDDWFYNALQTGYTPTTVLPDNQQSGNYSVNMIAGSYTYLFQ